MAADDDDSAEIGSEVLNAAGQFAFIFPGAGQVVGGALTFLGGLLGLAASSPTDTGPTLGDLDNHISAVAKLVKAVPGHVEKFDIKTSLNSADTELAKLKTQFDEVVADSSTLIVHGQDTPDLVKETESFDPGQSPLQSALSEMKALTDRKDLVAALLLYADTRNRFNGQVRDYMLLQRVIYEKNYDYKDDDGSFANRSTYGEKWEDWWAPPKNHDTLHIALRQSLIDGVTFLEPVLQKLKHGGTDDAGKPLYGFRGRLAHAQAEAAESKTPAQTLKKTWDSVTSSEFLDQISEDAVDSLLGTDTMMGVVDIWKDKLNTNFGGLPEGMTFARGDKLDPPRFVPTIWFNKIDTPQLKAIAKGGTGNALAFAGTKQQSKLAADDRPMRAPLRAKNIDAKARMLSVVILNTTVDPLLVEEIFIGAGGVISQPLVPDYPHIDMGNPVGMKSTPNPNSANPKVWIDANPSATDDGPSAAGIWQFLGLPSKDQVQFCIRFKPMPKAGYDQIFVAGEYNADQTRQNYVSVGVSDDHPRALDYFTHWIGDGHERAATSHSSGVWGSITPKDCSGSETDIVLTAVVTAHDTQ